MLKLTALTDPSWLDELTAAIEVDVLDRAELAYQQLGREVIDYLVSLAEPPEWRPALARSRRTGELYQPRATRRRLGLGIRDAAGNLVENDPLPGPLQLATRRPDTRMEGPRRAHPGHWADRRGQLALSYSFEVIRTPTSVTLILRNTAEYAFYVEAMEGFFVLSGVTDPGGPVEQAFRAIAARLFPDWRVVDSGVTSFTVTEVA